MRASPHHTSNTSPLDGGAASLSHEEKPLTVSAIIKDTKAKDNVAADHGGAFFIDFNDSSKDSIEFSAVDVNHNSARHGGGTPTAKPP